MDATARLEIDENAKISLSEDGFAEGPQGAYVQAWVYVEFEEVTR